MNKKKRLKNSPEKFNVASHKTAFHLIQFEFAHVWPYVVRITVYIFR